MNIRAVLAMATLGALAWALTVPLRVGDSMPLPSSGSHQHLRLAREGALHFVLDAEARTLNLFHGGAILRSWPVHDVEAGVRRLALGGEELERTWHARSWSTPRLDPPVVRVRRVIESDSVTPPDPSGTDEWIPLAPEEAVPPPSRFIVHYEGGLGLEFVGRGEGLLRPGIVRRAVDALTPNLPWGDRVRVRVAVDGTDAGSLYRSFPPDASLVIILPTTTPGERVQ